MTQEAPSTKAGGWLDDDVFQSDGFNHHPGFIETRKRGTSDVYDEESEYSLSDESYHSHYSTDQEVEEENSPMDRSE
ncbi:hypothetical protein L1987_18260 [Smallanthus sonchifolius]|uniref:Uncharacterized protein n=1 Tax=Smallanthus sonchifolius TaxID=185202 RepID=A0ACB9IZ33_9ASTR|nr:hypothetical protein L1987_18260 [Smallanthus sonchifolius]